MKIILDARKKLLIFFKLNNLKHNIERKFIQFSSSDASTLTERVIATTGTTRLSF